MMKFLAFLLTCIAFVMPPNELTSAAESGLSKVTFDEHVKPILRQHCSSCHNLGDKKGGLNLDAYAALVEGGASGEIVFDDGDYDG